MLNSVIDRILRPTPDNTASPSNVLCPPARCRWACCASPSAASIPSRACSASHDRLKPAYDVVIIGAGGHGLAAAYYLARDHGMTNVAVLEKGYIGGGNTGRNTTIIRSNYLTPEGVAFYDESVRLWQDLAEDFDLNLFYSTRGHFTLAHTDSAMRTMRWRAEVNKHFGVDSELVGPGVRQAPLPADRHRPAAATRRSWARCTTRPARSRATTRWPGATAAAPTGAASRSTSRPKSSASTCAAARSRACAPRAATSRRPRCCARWPASRRACSTWSGCARRSTSIRCRRW